MSTDLFLFVFRPGSFEAVVPVSSGLGDEGGDININVKNLEIEVNG